jgi:hypothetical protein
MANFEKGKKFCILMIGSCVILLSCPSCSHVLWLCGLASAIGHTHTLGSSKKITHLLRWLKEMRLVCATKMPFRYNEMRSMSFFQACILAYVSRLYVNLGRTGIKCRQTSLFITSGQNMPKVVVRER